VKQSALSLAVTSLLAGTPALATHLGSTTLALGSGGSINTESAIPLERGRWSLGLRTEQLQSDRLSDAHMLELIEADPEADLHSIESLTTTLLNASIGLSDNFMLGVSLPFVERTDIRAAHFHEEDNEFEIEQEGNASGIGDLRVFGLWRFAQTSDTHTALLFGTTVSTGKDDAISPQGELYEPEFQPGSGSSDPFVGIVHSRSFGRVTVDLSATYNAVSAGSQATDLGDWATYNAGMSYLLTPGGGTAWRLVVEGNGVWRDRLTHEGEQERNSGGSWLNLSPGIVAGRGNWSIFGNVAIPVINEPNGDQDEQDYRFQLGFQVGL